MTCFPFLRRRPFAADDNASEVTIAEIGFESQKAKHIAHEHLGRCNTFMCMLFVKAAGVTPRPSFPTRITTQQPTVATVSEVMPGRVDDSAHSKPAIRLE